ncbi:cell division protein FtsA [Campylobacter geochelonis]|uniref:Cell division protein FtsA n=1 Tax=Campylobacter geochelonis TaxID=1780362 RepID=A0A128EPY2_9BACT|nr:cell division protein FtsA [Campylobacter geochelonis]QKF71523.1 cell division protein FtsA [Campylobacter geochelonis]CZE47933.1 cell division protein FtsA [Campylobacter geochelonis]CZE48482.1 cell division protein FtsA [Campylobacter geochelonis]CZE50793.1 cell division protein FtsA [Campylobacter geochelonis]
MNNYILGLDIGSVDVSAAIAKVTDKHFSICGIGKSKTSGIRKGSITNIERAAKSISDAILEATKSAGTKPDKVIVSISGSYTKSVKSQGIVSVSNQEITLNEIKRAMQLAKENAVYSKDQIILHVLPYDFKVDGQEHIEDPIGMSGSRLEVCTHVITANENSIKNLIKSVEIAGLKIDNMVLSGYASAISTLNKDEKELGVALIDMGGATCDIVVHLGNSLRYNDVLPIGSSSITNDLSHAVNTPLADAEELKLNYEKLISENTRELEVKTMGETSATHTISLDIITNVIYARIEETLMLLANKLEDSRYIDQLGAGVVLTGGMAKLDDIRNLTTAIFDNIPVRVAKPKKVAGLYEISDDPANACVVGLCLYGAGEFTPYELDSKGELKYEDKNLIDNQRIEYINSYQEEAQTDSINQSAQEKIEDNTSVKLSTVSNKSGEPNSLKKLWNRLIQLF